MKMVVSMREMHRTVKYSQMNLNSAGMTGSEVVTVYFRRFYIR
jgi:hypothetical protein